jgi:hypothetical protein
MGRTPWAGATSTGFPPATRRHILERDPVCRCRGCTRCTPDVGCTRRSTEANHIVRPADGGTHHPTNGEGLCSPCHLRLTLAQAAAGRARRPGRRRPPPPHPGLRQPADRPGAGPTTRGGGVPPSPGPTIAGRHSASDIVQVWGSSEVQT